MSGAVGKLTATHAALLPCLQAQSYGTVALRQPSSGGFRSYGVDEASGCLRSSGTWGAQGPLPPASWGQEPTSPALRYTSTRGFINNVVQ